MKEVRLVPIDKCRAITVREGAVREENKQTKQTTNPLSLHPTNQKKVRVQHVLLTLGDTTQASGIALGEGGDEV